MRTNVEVDECPKCSGRNIIMIEENGQFVYRDCGTVVVTRVFTTEPEWKAHTMEELLRKTRTGSPMDNELVLPSSVSSEINVNVRRRERRLSAMERMLMVRLDGSRSLL
ncbi:MAG: hypothetical protein ACP5IZ_02815 [Thermoprotei archaeon]|jgi:transcription initiation factor TFIIIB Brf1 subunit/transcription initiation factor TFIIB